MNSAPKTAILRCTHDRINPDLKNTCLKRLQAVSAGIEIYSVENSLTDELCLRTYLEHLHEVAHMAMLSGHSHAFVAEHDVLYPEDYFTPLATPNFSYTKNVIYLCQDGFRRRRVAGAPLSTLLAPIDLLIVELDCMIAVLATGGKLSSAEPGQWRGSENSLRVGYRDLSAPVVDVRHGENLTGSRTGGSPRRTNKYWGSAKKLWHSLGLPSPVSTDEPAPIGDTATDAEPPEAPRNPPAEKPAAPAIVRPKPDVCVVIPVRTDPHLVDTCNGVLDTCPGARIVVVADGWQRIPDGLPRQVEVKMPWSHQLGVGQARNHGISCARENDVVVILDAHMIFPDPDWLREMIDPLFSDPYTITCAASQVCHLEDGEIVPSGRVHTGATIAPPDGVSMPFDPVWCDDLPAGTEIQCPLGACYAFFAERYRAINTPWMMTYGWGSSEQILSVANYHAGGKTILADTAVGHMYYRPDDPMPYTTPPHLRCGKYFNRLVFISLLSPTEKIFSNLFSAILAHIPMRMYAELNEMYATCHLSRLVSALDKRQWEDYVDAWWPDVDFSKTIQPPPKGTTDEPAPPAAGRHSVDEISPDHRQWI